MNFLSLFVLIPILMMAGLAIARDMKQIRTVAVAFSTLQLGLAIYTAIICRCICIVENRASVKRVFLVAHTPLDWCIWILYLDRLVYHVHVLRGSTHPYVPTYRCMG